MFAHLTMTQWGGIAALVFMLLVVAVLVIDYFVFSINSLWRRR